MNWDTYTPAHVLTVPHVSTHCPSSTGSGPCSDSLVYLPGNSSGNEDPGNGYMVDALFVWLPGAGGGPANNENILQIAAFAGYRTIGLSYYNPDNIEQQCAGEPCQLDYVDDCAYQVRMERLTGVDNPNTTGNVVPDKTFIAYRLLEVLQELEAWDIYNDWDFGQYCVASRGGCSTTPHGPWLDRIKWDRIVLAGFSHGAGYGHLMSLQTELDGIVSIDGGNDRCATPNGSSANREPGYLRDLGHIWSQTGGASPGNGEFAALHLDHDFEGMDSPEIVPDAYPHVQLHPAVHNIDVSWTSLSQNVVRTDQNWPDECINVVDGVDLGFHNSMARDDCMPTEATWNLTNKTQVQPATYAPDLHLFRAYVEGFCDARAL